MDNQLACPFFLSLSLWFGFCVFLFFFCWFFFVSLRSSLFIRNFMLRFFGFSVFLLLIFLFFTVMVFAGQPLFFRHFPSASHFFFF